MSCTCLHLLSRIMVCSGKWPIGLYRKRFLGEPFSTCMIVGGRIPRKHRPLQKVTCMSQSLMHQQPFKLRLTEHITVSSNLQTKLTRTHINFTLLKLAKICKCNHKNKKKQTLTNSNPINDQDSNLINHENLKNPSTSFLCFHQKNKTLPPCTPRGASWSTGRERDQIGTEEFKTKIDFL